MSDAQVADVVNYVRTPFRQFLPGRRFSRRRIGGEAASDRALNFRRTLLAARA